MVEFVVKKNGSGNCSVMSRSQRFLRLIHGTFRVKPRKIKSNKTRQMSRLLHFIPSTIHLSKLNNACAMKYFKRNWRGWRWWRWWGAQTDPPNKRANEREKKNSFTNKFLFFLVFSAVYLANITELPFHVLYFCLLLIFVSKVKCDGRER